MKAKITVYENSLELLKDIAKDVFEGEDVTVILFGSRARGDYLETSDMDVGVLPRGEVKYPTASCGALREGEPPHPRLRTGPLSSPQQAGGYPAESFMNLSIAPAYLY